MSRSRHITLERSETSVHGGRSQHDRRRAEIEEQIAAAYANGDTEMVSRLRAALIEAGGEE